MVMSLPRQRYVLKCNFTPKNDQERMSLMRSGSRREQLMKCPITLFDFQQRDATVDASSISFCATKGGRRISDEEVIRGYLLVPYHESHSIPY